RFEQAGMVLVAGRVSWLGDVAAAAVAPAELCEAEFGAPRSVEHALIVPLHWESESGPFRTLDADLRLEPVPPARSHLGFSGTYELPSPGTSSRDAVTRQHLVEACVPRFIGPGAPETERGGPKTGGGGRRGPGQAQAGGLPPREPGKVRGAAPTSRRPFRPPPHAAPTRCRPARVPAVPCCAARYPFRPGRAHRHRCRPPEAGARRRPPRSRPPTTRSRAGRRSTLPRAGSKGGDRPSRPARPSRSGPRGVAPA